MTVPPTPSPAPTRPPTSRLAPSPTGALHLGNARTFLVNWTLARKCSWRLVLRIEDLDTPRVKEGSVAGLMDTLTWLGIDWDPPGFGPPTNPLIQSLDLEPYRAAMRSLARRGLAYPCSLSRSEVKNASSAPQEGSHDSPFPVALRPSEAGQPLDFDRVEAEWAKSHAEPANWRFVTPPGPVSFTDGAAGPHEFDPSRIVGDFVLWTKRGQPSYQLAVVVDDHRQGVTHVVRGDDLLDSAARQLLLYRALEYTNRTGGGEPSYVHLPLVVGPDGRRLAKRHGDTRIDRYRGAGVPAEAVIGLLGAWSIPGCGRTPMTAGEFKKRFDLNTMPRGVVRFTNEDDAWLLSHGR